nr:1880_t:CDS:2 [Entrophospora candida]
MPKCYASFLSSLNTLIEEEEMLRDSAVQMIGLAQEAYDHALPYLFQREQFVDLLGMQLQYAQIATEIEAARLLTYNAARMKMLY